MVEAQDLHFSYGSQRAVDGVSFQVKPGEIFGLLGPNGAGKTTTFLLLAGLLVPQRGQVRIGGGTPRDARARQRLGFAPQSFAVYEQLSAEENLRFFGTLAGVKGPNLEKKGAFLLGGRRSLEAAHPKGEHVFGRNEATAERGGCLLPRSPGHPPG